MLDWPWLDGVIFAVVGAPVLVEALIDTPYIETIITYPYQIKLHLFQAARPIWVRLYKYKAR